MTTTARAWQPTAPTIKSRHKKRLLRRRSTSQKPINQAVLRPFTAERRARTAVVNCIKDGTLIDPACGTGTFHAEIIKYIKDTYFSGGRDVFYHDYIKNEDGLLSRLIGFEIMMTSYVVAHLNIRRAIDETLGYTPEKQLPTNIYMTNTLAPPTSEVERTDQMSLFDFSAAISDEAYKADTWKTRRPIKVIIGNPPYLAASTNPFDISAYKFEVDGATKLQEKNSKSLNDDYVKFFRFAEQIIANNDEGILAFVSNNSYLDYPIFRGMRASLLKTFNKIFIVNLNGSTIKKDVAPDGSKDENVFDIMQGVSLFVGFRTKAETSRARVFYSELWGLRKVKYNALSKNELSFTELQIDEKMAYFIPFGNPRKVVYEKGIGFEKLFRTNVTGATTGNDRVAVALTKKEIEMRIEVVKHAVDDETILRLFGKFVQNQNASKIQEDVLDTNGVITKIAYRPFDDRWTYYSGKSGAWMDRPREMNVMGQMLKEPTSPLGGNCGLIFARGGASREDFTMISLTNNILDKNYAAASIRCIVTIAPLYLYNETDDSWTPNFSPDVLAQLTEHLSIKPEPIEIFDYIYGILHDPIYRERFNEFLKRDFPRVPIINNIADKDNPDAFYVSEERFRAYVTAGERLRKLHLLQEKVPAMLEIESNNSENMVIDIVKYKDGVLSINAHKKILGIPEEVWTYRIGGYQVLDKWFKSHKGETLTVDRFDHICNVVGLLAETIKVQEELSNMHA